MSKQEIQKVPEGNVEHVEVVAVEANAIEVMERAAIDVQVATAHKFRRDLKVFIEKAKELVSVDRSTAESCIYRRPVGRDEEGAGQKFVEGESIRLAEIVAATYGNLRVAAIISEIGLRHVKAIGFAHDLESNYAAKAETAESTVSKNGRPYSERMRLVTAKAAQSKAMRDAIFRVVPKSVCKPIIDEARRIILSGRKTLTERRQVVAHWLKKLPIDNNRVFTALNINSLNDIGDEELETLTGLRTAMKDGEITIDEAFPPLTFDEKRQETQQQVEDKAGSENVDVDFDKNKPAEKTKKTKKKTTKKATKKKEDPKPKPLYVCDKNRHEFNEPKMLGAGDSRTAVCPTCYRSDISKL